MKLRGAGCRVEIPACKRFLGRGLIHMIIFAITFLGLASRLWPTITNFFLGFLVFFLVNPGVEGGNPTPAGIGGRGGGGSPPPISQKPEGGGRG